ncbi:MAG: hypothetical protein ACXWFC_14115 [Nitrososphaeraceae archaeon]
MVNIDSNRIYISFVLLFTVVLVCTIITITSGSILNYVDANVGMDGAMGGDADSENIGDVIGGEADSESGGSDDGDENEIPFTQICVQSNSCANSDF